MTFLALPLVAWDVHLAPLRMGYDTGAPFWPFEIPSVLLILCDAPASILARPFVGLFDARSALSRDSLILIATPPVWYWIGDRIDRGLLRPPYRFRRLLAVSLLLIAILVLCMEAQNVHEELHWRHVYGNGAYELVKILRELPDDLWAGLLICVSSIAAIRLLRGKNLAASATARRDHLITTLAVTVWLAAFALIPAVGFIRNYNHADRARGNLDPNSCENDTSTGCIHGLVQRVTGGSIMNIDVDAIPLSASPDLRFIRTKTTYTDRKGRSSFDNLEPDDYIVGVHLSVAPSQSEPYPRIFYPQTMDEEKADHIRLEHGRRVNLGPLSLRSLPLTTFSVELRWSDGSVPLRSNLLVENKEFKQATIGDTAPQIDKGSGAFTLPQNFDYTVHAAVTCDAGTTLEQRETNDASLHVTDHPEPAQLMLTLPGKPCKLWQPK